jgi:hypothetical protein
MTLCGENIPNKAKTELLKTVFALRAFCANHVFYTNHYEDFQEIRAAGACRIDGFVV